MPPEKLDLLQGTLDLLGRIAGVPLGLLVSDQIYLPEVNVYRANASR
jgi:hypothetical protein